MPAQTRAQKRRAADNNADLPSEPPSAKKRSPPKRKPKAVATPKPKLDPKPKAAPKTEMAARGKLGGTSVRGTEEVEVDDEDEEEDELARGERADEEEEGNDRGEEDDEYREEKEEEQEPLKPQRGRKTRGAAANRGGREGVRGRGGASARGRPRPGQGKTTNMEEFKDQLASSRAKTDPKRSGRPLTRAKEAVSPEQEAAEGGGVPIDVIRGPNAWETLARRMGVLVKEDSGGAVGRERLQQAAMTESSRQHQAAKNVAFFPLDSGDPGALGSAPMDTSRTDRPTVSTRKVISPTSGKSRMKLIVMNRGKSKSPSPPALGQAGNFLVPTSNGPKSPESLVSYEQMMRETDASNEQPPQTKNGKRKSPPAPIQVTRFGIGPQLPSRGRAPIDVVFPGIQSRGQSFIDELAARHRGSPDYDPLQLPSPTFPGTPPDIAVLIGKTENGNEVYLLKVDDSDGSVPPIEPALGTAVTDLDPDLARYTDPLCSPPTPVQPMQLGQKMERRKSQDQRLLVGKRELEHREEMMRPRVFDRWGLMRPAGPRSPELLPGVYDIIPPGYHADDEHTDGNTESSESLPPELLTWEEYNRLEYTMNHDPDLLPIHTRYGVHFDPWSGTWNYLLCMDSNGGEMWQSMLNFSHDSHYIQQSFGIRDEDGDDHDEGVQPRAMRLRIRVVEEHFREVKTLGRIHDDSRGHDHMRVRLGELFTGSDRDGVELWEPILLGDYRGPVEAIPLTRYRDEQIRRLHWRREIEEEASEQRSRGHKANTMIIGEDHVHDGKYGKKTSNRIGGWLGRNRDIGTTIHAQSSGAKRFGELKLAVHQQSPDEEQVGEEENNEGEGKEESTKGSRKRKALKKHSHDAGTEAHSSKKTRSS
ncbi:MAG: hypothetical protein LQ340_002158 [Diploschistes diacapsis]|nr:MAG: hypothetical protein LQ340_002158 [Diploschistes diacapsis]